MSTHPEPAPPESAIEAAVAAAAEAITLTGLAPGPVVTGGHELPEDDPLLVAVTLSGAMTGTVTLAVGDEFEQRLEYAAKASGPTETLAPVVAAVVAALSAAGEPVEASDPVEVAAAAWPGEEPVASAGLADDGETVLALAFALTVPSPPAGGEEDEAVISGSGTSSLSTSAAPTGSGAEPDDGTESPEPDPRAPRVLPAVARSAEAARLAAVEVDISGVLGETAVALQDLLAWLPGVIVPLHRSVGMPVDVRIDDATVAHAEVVVVDERYALRVIDVVANARARLTRNGLRMAPPGIS